MPHRLRGVLAKTVWNHRKLVLGVKFRAFILLSVSKTIQADYGCSRENEENIFSPYRGKDKTLRKFQEIHSCTVEVAIALNIS